MKQIDGFFHVSDSNFDRFNKNILDDIRKLQSNNQEVEVQYKTTTNSLGEVVYSALLLGRK